MLEVVAFGTITVIVIAFVLVLFDGSVEQVATLLDLIANLRKIDKAKRSTVLFDQMLQGNSVEAEISVFKIKAFLWKVKALFNEVEI
jgi:hypothetical protein